jgi:hypothetical protein
MLGVQGTGADCGLNSKVIGCLGRVSIRASGVVFNEADGANDMKVTGIMTVRDHELRRTQFMVRDARQYPKNFSVTVVEQDLA